MATLKEQIIAELKKENGRSDRDLTDKILGADKTQNSVYAACRELNAQGIIRRTPPPVMNYLNDRYLRVTMPVQQEPKITTDKPLTTGLDEESIKIILNDHLKADGWQVKVSSGKDYGADIVANRGLEKWIIEIKGCGSNYAMRANYFHSIIGEILLRMDDTKAKYSIALPDMQQFRNLWQRFPRLAKDRTQINAIFISSDGAVTIE